MLQFRRIKLLYKREGPVGVAVVSCAMVVAAYESRCLRALRDAQVGLPKGRPTCCPPHARCGVALQLRIIHNLIAYD